MLPNAYVRLLEPTAFHSAGVQDPGRTIDAGGYFFVAAHLRVLQAGDAGTLRVQTAPHNSEDASDWHDLWTLDLSATTAVALDTGASSFMRYLRWKVDTPDNSPVATVELIAKNRRSAACVSSPVAGLAPWNGYAPNTYVRLLEPTIFSAGDVQDPARTIDAGAYFLVAAHLRVLSAGGGGTLRLQHAGDNSEDDADWHDLGAIALNGTQTFVSTGFISFLRYLRWKVDGDLSGAAVATIELILKNL